MKDFFGSRKFKILVATLAVVLGFMVASLYHEGSASLLSNIVSRVTVPIQKVSSSISNGVSEWFQKYTDSAALYDENQRLQTEVRELRDKMADYNTLKHENEQFNRFMSTVDGREDWEIRPASVIARDAQSRFYSFTIDRGTKDGVSHLDPVMSADGLVGYVYEVGSTYAKVLTILDVKVDVGVYDSTTRDIGVLSGTIELSEDGLCAVDYLPRESQVGEGNFILTSGSLTGGSSMYPRDIYIGKVIRVEPDAHGTNLRAVIEPATDIATVKDVFVITDFEGQSQK